MLVDFDVRGQQGMDFFTAGGMRYYGLWVDMDIDQDYFGQKQGFQV